MRRWTEYRNEFHKSLHAALAFEYRGENGGVAKCGESSGKRVIARKHQNLMAAGRVIHLLGRDWRRADNHLNWGGLVNLSIKFPFNELRNVLPKKESKGLDHFWGLLPVLYDPHSRRKGKSKRRDQKDVGQSMPLSVNRLYLDGTYLGAT